MINISFESFLDKLENYYPHISEVNIEASYGKRQVSGIENDSRKVREGHIFVAVRGYKIDGHQFIDSAIEKGALAVFIEDESYISSKQSSAYSVPIITFTNTRHALAVSARILFDNPSGKLKLIGITGTNGKTTITYMLRSILQNANKKVGLVGTICNYINDQKIKSPVTTPDSLELNKLFQDMITQGVGYVVMEVSSHALYLDRVAGLDFDAVIFTNLSADHLDFHRTMDEYLAVKLRILDVLAESRKKSSLAVINGDLEITDAFVNKAERLNLDYVTYGLKGENTFQASNIKYSLSESRFTVCSGENKMDVLLAMPGGF
ncbi:MAG: UDP-N-acetylmuramyl-tripeptide synthetase, partial [Spirochaetota bacterium]|nr:UDP-N-acetylmuramyl-tripeptide synthetase [Spirochaetota bacterium]